MSDDDNTELSEAEKSQTIQEPPPTALEWGVRLVSLGLVLALLGYLMLTGLNANDPVLLEATADVQNIEQRNGQWVIPAVVVNRGDLSVSDATVALALVTGDGTVVESEDVTIPLLGQSASTDVQFWFDTDPNDYTLQFDVGGLIVP